MTDIESGWSFFWGFVAACLVWFSYSRFKRGPKKAKTYTSEEVIKMMQDGDIKNHSIGFKKLEEE